MKKKGKIKTIIEAFTEKLPVNEDWYKERLEACLGCEFNSDNIDKKDLSFPQKTQIATLCSNSRMCTACGCCLDEKLSRKTETCGLKEKGLDPKWKALKAETSNTSNLDIEIKDKSAENIFIDTKTNKFIVELGEVSELVKEVKILISKEGGLKITKMKPACSCTVPKQEQLDEDTVYTVVKINTSSFSKGGSFNKGLTISYYQGRIVVKAVVDFKGIKK